MKIIEKKALDNAQPLTSIFKIGEKQKMEEFRQITDSNYEVSNLGTVRNSKTGRVLKPSNSLGYRTVGVNGITTKVHRLVCSHFLPNPENKRCVNHKNGIKHDNRLENLEWVTHQENFDHAYEVLGVRCGNLSGEAYHHHDNKGIMPWKIGKKKWRVILSDPTKKTKSISLGYFLEFEEAVEYYIKAHTKRFGYPPKNRYYNPEVPNKIIYNP